MKYKGKKTRKRTAKRILIVTMSIFFLYIIIGMLYPYIKPNQVSETRKKYLEEQLITLEEQSSIDRAALIESSQEALDIRIHMLEQAKEQILLSSFSIKNDRSCKEIFSVIYEAAERGVKVNILGDALTCAIDMRIDPMYYALSQHPNVEIKYYNPVNLLKPNMLNGRLHDKYIVIDNKLLVLGGRNTSNYFLGEYNENVLSYDRDVFIYNEANNTDKNEKSVIVQVKQYFNDIWNGQNCKIVFDKIPFYKKKKVERACLELKETYKTLKKERAQLFDTMDYNKFTVPVDSILLIHNPIKPTVKEPDVWYQIQTLMKQAKEEIIIQTPYIVLDKVMEQTIKEIQESVPSSLILTNSIAGGDNMMALSDYTLNRNKVVKMGMDLYEFQGKYSMHNKSILIDNTISIIGSYNLDMRSTYIDTEVMLVIKGEQFAGLLEKEMIEMKEESLRVLENGNYEQNEGVLQLELSTFKKIFYRITSYLFQSFRFLL